MGRVYVQVVHPMRHVKMNMSGGISGAIFKALCPSDMSKVFISQESISKVNVKVIWGYLTGTYIQGVCPEVCPREYVQESMSKGVCP